MSGEDWRTGNESGNLREGAGYVLGPAGTAHRNLYLLIRGVLAGALCGPGVLGRWGSQIRQRWFLSSGFALARLQEYERNAEGFLTRLRAGGATEAAISEKQREILQGRWPLVVELERLEQEQRGIYLGRMKAIVLAMVLMMGLEAFLNPAGRSV